MKVELTHLSFYRFYPIVDPIVLRMQLKSLCAQLELMGTILIAPEGINVGLGVGDAPERIVVARQGAPIGVGDTGDAVG